MENYWNCSLTARFFFFNACKLILILFLFPSMNKKAFYFESTYFTARYVQITHKRKAVFTSCSFLEQNWLYRKLMGLDILALPCTAAEAENLVSVCL